MPVLNVLTVWQPMIDFSCLLVDVQSSEQEELFIRKLHQCCVVFDFMDPVSDLKGKEIKRSCLNELVDFITTSRGILSEPVYPEIIHMVRFSFINFSNLSFAPYCNIVFDNQRDCTFVVGP